MISRLTASAAIFAVFATAGLAFAAEIQQHQASARAIAPLATPTVVLPRVEVIGHRVAR